MTSSKKLCPFDFNIVCEKADDCARWMKNRDCVVAVNYISDWKKAEKRKRGEG